VKARMARMEKALTDIQGQQQSTNAMLGNLPQPGAAQSGPPSPSSPPPVSNTPPDGSGTAVGQPLTTTTTSAPPVGELYRMAYGDFVAAKYPLAASEFSDLIKAYPDDNLSGNAYFFIGEIDVRTQKLTAAVKSYDQVLERYPDNTKIPAAHLHKAYAMISMKQNDKATLELKALIQRFPNSPEASQARAKLAALHGAGRE
jgi:tol-pal system protein YbgF